MIPQFLADFLLVAGFIAVGAWLENVGTMRDRVDEFFTPRPMGLLGCGLVMLEWSVA